MSCITFGNIYICFKDYFMLYKKWHEVNISVNFSIVITNIMTKKKRSKVTHVKYKVNLMINFFFFERSFLL